MAGSSKKVYEVFVSKIPWTLASKEMKDYFGQFGQVKKCLIPFDKETGFHRGFCWIGYTSEEGLNNALQKDPHVLEGSTKQKSVFGTENKQSGRDKLRVFVYMRGEFNTYGNRTRPPNSFLFSPFIVVCLHIFIVIYRNKETQCLFCMDEGSVYLYILLVTAY
uniref:SRA stem-loop interacting RNA binding protein n=1 Tax=Oncorhynchus mykiss TaxID=8022 RepID=A0A8C7PTF1_ONCMY